MPADQHGVEVPDAARDAWQAYCDMLSSKDAYFGHLESLHRKYESGGRRTLAETAYLEQLLATHDGCVKHFAGAMRELGGRDREAHARLVSAIAELNRTLGNEDPGSAN